MSRRQPVGLTLRGQRSSWAPISSWRSSESGRFSSAVESLRSWWTCTRPDTLRPQRSQAPAAAAPSLALKRQAPPEDDVPPEVCLTVDFARFVASPASRMAPGKIRITAFDENMTDDGVGALLEMLDVVLSVPGLCPTFVLTCDLRQIDWPPPDLVFAITAWSSDEERRSRWTKACLCWKLVVPSGVYFMVSEKALTMFFYFHPPLCRTFLLTDPDDIGASAVIFEPEGQQETGCASSSSGGDVPEEPGDGGAEGAGSPSVSSQARAADDDPDAIVLNLPPTKDVGFLLMTQGVRPDGRAEIKLLGREGVQNRSNVMEMLDFLDKFSRTAHAQRGFAICFDLRSLSVPPMSLIKEVADWGNEKARVQRWNRLNFACKVVVRSGVTFAMAKGILHTYFYACPPVCRTYLLTDPDEPEEAACYYDPARPRAAAAEAESARAPEAGPGAPESPLGGPVERGAPGVFVATSLLEPGLEVVQPAEQATAGVGPDPTGEREPRLEEPAAPYTTGRGADSPPRAAAVEEDPWDWLLGLWDRPAGEQERGEGERRPSGA